MKKKYLKIHKFIRFWLLLAWWFVCHRLPFLRVFVARRGRCTLHRSARVRLSSIGYYSWNYVCKISILNACWIDEKKLNIFPCAHFGRLSCDHSALMVGACNKNRRMLRSYQIERVRGNVKERICMLYLLVPNIFRLFNVRHTHFKCHSFWRTPFFGSGGSGNGGWGRGRTTKKTARICTLKAYKVVRVEESKKISGVSGAEAKHAIESELLLLSDVRLFCRKAELSLLHFNKSKCSRMKRHPFARRFEWARIGVKSNFPPKKRDTLVFFRHSLHLARPQCIFIIPMGMFIFFPFLIHLIFFPFASMNFRSKFAFPGCCCFT